MGEECMFRSLPEERDGEVVSIKEAIGRLNEFQDIFARGLCGEQMQSVLAQDTLFRSGIDIEQVHF